MASATALDREHDPYDRERIMMRQAAMQRRMTVEEFLDLFDDVDERWELIAGAPVMMAGATARHNQIAGNIYFALRSLLRGTGCQPYGPDMGLRIDAEELRYPDVGVYCDPRDLELDPMKTREFSHPKLLFEVLSESTARDDIGTKAPHYRGIESLDAVVFVDPRDERIELVTRISPNQWLNTTLRPDQDLELATLKLVILRTEIFRAD